MSQDTKEPALLSQSAAVEDYLSALMSEPEVEEAASVSRAAENMVEHIVSDAPTLMEEDVTHDESVIESGEEVEMEVVDEAIDDNETPEVFEEPVEELPQDPATQMHEEIIEDEEPAINIEYRDVSDDPEVIAEAEKMLSFVFPQPQAAENTPLRKLQDAGIIQVSDSPDGSTIGDGFSSGNAFKNDAPVQLVPAFSADRFTIMNFRVSRLSMMVAVTELRNVKKPEGELLPIFGKPSWLLEYRKTEGGSAFVVDGTELFVPDGAAKMSDSAQEEMFIIWLLDGRVGILCDEVQEMSEINRRQVTWRGSKAQRPWLAGTVRSMRAVLIDGESLVEMVDSQF